MLHGPLSASSVKDQPHWLTLLLLPICLIVFTVGLASAQSGTDPTGTGGRHVIIGRIFFPSGQRVDTQTMVRLEGTNTGGLSVMSDADGNFRFSSLAPGPYTIVVDGGDNYETVRESVYIENDVRPPRGVTVPTFTRNYTVNIDLRPKRTVVPASKTGVIDASLAAVPEGPRKLYEQGVEAARANKHQEAVNHLLSAIAGYPEFAQAYNELGVQYSHLDQFDKAVQAFRSAVRFAPDAFVPRFNLGKALFRDGKATESETELLAALKMNQADPNAYFWLGLVHINLKKLAEAEKDFRRSLELGGKDQFMAHYYLGGIYWRSGDRKRAAEELEQYLKLNPKAEQADQIRKTIQELRSKFS